MLFSIVCNHSLYIWNRPLHYSCMHSSSMHSQTKEVFFQGVSSSQWPQLANSNEWMLLRLFQGKAMDQWRLPKEAIKVHLFVLFVQCVLNVSVSERHLGFPVIPIVCRSVCCQIDWLYHPVSFHFLISPLYQMTLHHTICQNTRGNLSTYTDYYYSYYAYFYD